MYTASGRDIAIIIGHHQRFNPCLLTNHPPIMPPASRPITPKVPYAKPTVVVSRPRPPSFNERSMNGCAILASCASGKRNNSMNSMAGTMLGFEKNVRKVPAKALVTFSFSIICSTGLARATPCHMERRIIITASNPIVILHANGTL